MKRKLKEFFSNLFDALKHPRIILRNMRLCHRYPFLIVRNRWTGKKVRTFYTYTELDAMPNGWRLAFGKQMCEEIRQELKKIHRLKDYRIMEIKEKYGTLRWYDSWTTDVISKIVGKYEYLSMCYCINCGKPVRYISSGWISYLCEDCKSIDWCRRLKVSDIPSSYTYKEGKIELIKYDVDFVKMWDLDLSKTYYLPEETNMYDMCYCTAKCCQDCARKKAPEGICTMSDFSSVCEDFESEEEDK